MITVFCIVYSQKRRKRDTQVWLAVNTRCSARVLPLFIHFSIDPASLEDTNFVVTSARPHFWHVVLLLLLPPFRNQPRPSRAARFLESVANHARYGTLEKLFEFWDQRQWKFSLKKGNSDRFDSYGINDPCACVEMFRSFGILKYLWLLTLKLI